VLPRLLLNIPHHHNFVPLRYGLNFVLLSYLQLIVKEQRVLLEILRRLAILPHKLRDISIDNVQVLFLILILVTLCIFIHLAERILQGTLDIAILKHFKFLQI
jgi:hypothetical protein